MFSDEEAKALKSFFEGHATFRADVMDNLLQILDDNRELRGFVHSLQVQIWFLYGTVAALIAFGAIAYFVGAR